MRRSRSHQGRSLPQSGVQSPPRPGPHRRQIVLACRPALWVTSHSPQIHFCEVDAVGVGIQWIIDAGFKSAIDVWSPLAIEAEVCFAGAGSLLLLDAAYAPRKVLSWPSYAWAGKTCAQLDRAGTLVLMPGSPSVTLTPTATLVPRATSAPVSRDQAYLVADNQDLMKPLENCQVSTLATLNFRASPAGPILGWLNGVVTTLARTPNWFQVVYNGELGWVSAEWVTTIGDCG